MVSVAEQERLKMLHCGLQLEAAESKTTSILLNACVHMISLISRWSASNSMVVLFKWGSPQK